MPKIKSRKTKAKHPDFQKVKFKVGKRLPKGLNETKATFQSTSIVLKEQFKSDILQPTTKRKLNINEILVHCQHFNAGIKHDALQGMKELINTNPVILNSFLPGILDQLCTLFVDKDAVVRSTVQKILKIVFQKVSSPQITPFFPVVSAHLCCAMTHIQDDIKLDSLSVLDLCLENYPALVIANTSQLLPNFIEQISQQSHSKGDKPGKQRTLLINPNSKLSSQKWRVKVLERLFRFLKAVLESHGGTVDKLNKNKDQVMNRDIREKTSASCTILGSSAERHFTFRPSLRSDGITGSSSGGADLLSEPKKYKSYFQTLVPLLMQCWIEAGPAQMTAGSKAGNILSYDALVTLANVMGVLQLLIQIVHQHIEDNEHMNMSWIQETYLDDFVHYFMTYFPYSVHSGWGKRIKKSSKEKEVSVNSINLFVCDVMSYFLDAPGVTKTKWFGWIVSYLNEQLTSDIKITSSDLCCIIRILDKAVKLTSQKRVISNALESACDLYQRKHPASVDAQALLLFFSRLVLQGGTKDHLKSLPSITWWLGVLPEHAAQIKGVNETASLKIYTVMNSAGAQNESAFLTSLQQNLDELIDPEYIKAIKPSVQAKLIEVLYWAPELNRHHVTKLSLSCHGGGFTADNVLYLLQVLQMRVEISPDGKRQGQVSPGDFISFLLSVIVGYSKEELDDLSSTSQVPRCTVLNGDKERWKFTHTVSAHSRLALKRLTSEEDTWNVLGPFIEQILTTWPCLPFSVWIGAMEILSEFYPKDPSCNSAAAVRLMAEWSLSFVFQIARKNIQLDDEDSADIGVGWDQPRPNTSLQIVVDICSEFLTRVTGCFAEIVGLIKEKVLKQDASAGLVSDYVTSLTWLMRQVDPTLGKDTLPMLAALQDTIKSTIVDADIYQWFGTYKIEVKNWETKNKTAAKMAT